VSEIRSLGLQKLVVAAIMGFFAYTIVSYSCCCFCCSFSTRIEKEKEVASTQKHKKLISKRNPRNSKPRKICRFQH
jgi:hypothetical protein